MSVPGTDSLCFLKASFYIEGQNQFPVYSGYIMKKNFGET